MTTTIVMSAYEISGLSHPSYPSAAARKKYVDDISGNCKWRFPGSSTAITKFLASSAFKRNNWNPNAWKNSGLIWNSDLSAWTAKPSGSAGGITKLSQLDIDTTKDWGTKAIINLGGISSTRITTPSIWGGGMAGNNMEFIKTEYLGDSVWKLTVNESLSEFDTVFEGYGIPYLLYIKGYNGGNGGSNKVGVYNNDPLYTLHVGGDFYASGIKTLSLSSQNISGGRLKSRRLEISGSSAFSGQINLQGNTISGLSTPLWPSSAANKKYVDDREVNIEGQITTLQSNLEGQIATLGIEDLDDVAIMTPANGRVLTWIDAQSAWSSQAAQGGVTYISSCTDASISGWTSGQVLTWNGSDWSNKYPALTFNVANVRLSANTYLNLTQFNTGAGKSCYVLQASCCNSSCASISGIRVQVLDDNSVIYETSSSTIRQGGPLAKSNAASQMKIRFMYSGSHSRLTGYKYGNAFTQVVVY